MLLFVFIVFKENCIITSKPSPVVAYDVSNWTNGLTEIFCLCSFLSLPGFEMTIMTAFFQVVGK